MANLATNVFFSIHFLADVFSVKGAEAGAEEEREGGFSDHLHHTQSGSLPSGWEVKADARTGRPYFEKSVIVCVCVLVCI